MNEYDDSLNLTCMCGSHDMTIKDCAKMPTCNLVEILHNQWLKKYDTKRICLYKATMDDMIDVFIQIANYKAWLKGVLMVKVLIWHP